MGIFENDTEEAIEEGRYPDDVVLKHARMWATLDGKTFSAVQNVSDRLEPGVYTIVQTGQIYFIKANVNNEPLINFPDMPCDVVMEDINKFWNREHLFRKHKFPFKRGILLYGPPGSGKSCIARLVMEDVIRQGGIVIRFTDPDAYVAGMHAFRSAHPDLPVVVLMEDIESILDAFHESTILNILDGVDKIDKVVYLATTNYPEALGERIKNRPSRFDRRLEIGYPSLAARRIYLQHLFHEDELKSYDLEQWTRDSEGFTFAHVKELFISVVLFGMPYDDVLVELRSMYDEVGESLDPIRGRKKRKKRKRKKRRHDSDIVCVTTTDSGYYTGTGTGEDPVILTPDG